MEAAKTNKECACLKAHGYNINTVLANESGISQFMPTGMKAVFLSRNQSLRVKLAKFYRLYSLDEIYPDFWQNKDKTLNCVNLFLRDFKKGGKKIDLPEDIRIIISDGEFNAFGKFLAEKLNKHSAGVKHLMCGASNLSHFDFIKDSGDGKINIFNTSQFCPTNNTNHPPKGIYQIKEFNINSAAIADFDNIDVASAFAFVINTYFSLFDWDISSLLFGGAGVCNYCFNGVKNTAHRLLEAAKSLPKRSAQLKKEAFSACVTMAGFIETAGPPLLLNGSVQAAAAFSMLLNNEKRPLIDLTEAAFLFSPAVARLYTAFLEELPFSFPPDNLLHSAKLSEYLGVSEFESAGLPPAYLKRKDLELADYRLKVYKGEILQHIYGVTRLLDEAYPVYLKLFEDDGFWLKDFLVPPDVSLSLALGSDVLYGNTLLHYIRGKGLLDRFLY